MLQYMRQGVEDPERRKLYQKLLTDTLEITDQARITLLDSVSNHYYHQYRTRLSEEVSPLTLEMLMHTLESFNDDLAVSGFVSDQNMEEVLKRHEDSLKTLFLQTWTHTNWTAGRSGSPAQPCFSPNASGERSLPLHKRRYPQCDGVFRPSRNSYG